jgi:hypothetical protein
MASIVYSICGEGRGHATRARAVVEGLRTHHRVTLFASGCAHEMLERYCRETGVALHHIPGLHFEYTDAGRVALLRTVGAAAGFKAAIGKYVRQVQPLLERIEPDLVVADFEPISCGRSAADRARVSSSSLMLDALALIAIGFVGTVVWVFSPEAAAALYATQRGWHPLLIGVLAATGQAIAHVTLFFAGDQLRRRWTWFDRRCERARARHGRWLAKGLVPLGCASGLAGLPPSSVTAALAPGLGFSARVLLPLMFVMRTTRLTVIAALAAGFGARFFGP